ncbi:MAG: hypothetical protein ACE15B_20260 [Bryobacteraceae bacterium]
MFLSVSKRFAAAAAAVASVLILDSCSSAPPAAQKGTPAFYWQGARETYASGDYLKTVENLDNVVRTENEFTGRARTWLLVLTSGMAKGYIEMADIFEGGARINKANPLVFRRQVTNARGAASRVALRFAEVFAEFQNTKEDPVPLAFPFPNGSPALPPVLTRIGNGILPQEADLEAAQKGSISRGVLLAACQAAGAPGDAAKAQAMFKAGDAKVPRGQFVLAMAAVLHDSAQLFTRNKLDQPDKLQIFCERALETLKGLPENKDTKDLKAKIEATLKKNKA